MSRRRWRLGAVIVLQLAILALIPLRQVRARLEGREITLETVPVDPYDLLSGYHVTLRYAAEQLPFTGGDADAGTGWLVVVPGTPAWKAITCTRAYEPPARPGELAIAAEIVGERCQIPSAGRFYVPEARRQEVDAALRRVGGRALVDLKVDADGNVALVRLRVGALTLGGGR
jgi:uncharacterized membrane-anchored protein